MSASKERIAAVRSVSLVIPEGEFFGLLGPNGAGKTTLVKMLCTLILPDSGGARIAGIDLANDRAIRAVTGLVVSDERSFYWRLTVRQNLAFFATLFGLSGKAADQRIDQVLADVNLSDRHNQRFSDLSSGLRQRLAIARALLHRPRILFLDEPTRSLDPGATEKLHDLLRALQRDSALTIMLITHDLAEAEKLCDRVALLHQGVIRATGAPRTLREQLDPRRRYALTVEMPGPAVIEQLEANFADHAFLIRALDADRLQISFDAGEHDATLQSVLSVLHESDVRIHVIEGAPATLEEVFAYYTGEEEHEND
ncbi:MAG: ABC transporter ATP-binding protein [Candidatus Promineifilaceae bacterium]